MQQPILKSFELACVKYVVEYSLGQHSNHFRIHFLSLANDLRGADFDRRITSYQRVLELEQQLLFPCLIFRFEAKYLNGGIDF